MESVFAIISEIIVLIIIVYLVLTLLYQIYYQIRNMIRTKNYSFKDRHVFITGGSQGLGKCLAERIAREYGSITIVARRENICKEAVEEIKKILFKETISSTRIQYYCADVTKEDEIASVVKKAEKSFGPIEFLITCHGVSLPKYAFEATSEEAKKVMDVNYWGTFNTFRAVIPGMMKRNKGEVLSVSSQLALCTFIGYAHYSPTKYAIRSLVDTLRCELNGYNIKVYIYILFSSIVHIHQV